ncbi:MAG TPA: DUF2007 domain-containing protein [Longimicrobium sp.]|jgi:hypothetical protein|uniref:putative signal transducing protein n=1 Tax=Longimicrobium sp. TaxID=2029185 RepID=UPI002EDB73C3
MVMPRPEEWVVVRNCGWLHEAHVIVAVLEAEGIDTFLPDSHVAGIRPELSGALGGIRVLVRESDLELAHEILSAEAETELPDHGMLMDDDDSY